MNIIGLVPARMGSSRYPGKPMAEICGMPMIGHVLFRSKMAKSLSEVYVATCDREIADYVTSIGGKVIMTSPDHERATERVSEAMQKIEAELNQKIDIAVMIQGDEPMVTPEMIEAAVAPMVDDPSILVVNLMAPLETTEEHDDPNEVKVVCDLSGNARYFSREAIPSRKMGTKIPSMLKQVCIIPFQRDFLIQFNQLPCTPLEIAESVDMMRVLEHGYTVKMVLSPQITFSVDTPSDLQEVEGILRNDPLNRKYLR